MIYQKYTVLHILFLVKLIDTFVVWSEYKRREANLEKHKFDFASMMVANEISEEKIFKAFRRNVFKKKIHIVSRPQS